MAVDRSDLAILSWRKAYRRFNKDPLIMEVIEFICSRSLQPILHASSSMHSLIIRSKHRYDSKVDHLTFSHGRKGLTLTYTVYPDEHKVTVCNDSFLPDAENLINTLLEKYNLS